MNCIFLIQSKKIMKSLNVEENDSTNEFLLLLDFKPSLVPKISF